MLTLVVGTFPSAPLQVRVLTPRNLGGCRMSLEFAVEEAPPVPPQVRVLTPRNLLGLLALLDVISSHPAQVQVQAPRDLRGWWITLVILCISSLVVTAFVIDEHAKVSTGLP